MHTTKHLSRILVALIPMLAIGCDVEQYSDDIQEVEFDGDDVTVVAGEPTSFPLEVQSAMDQAMTAEFGTELGTMEVGNNNQDLFIEVSAHAGYKLSYLEIHVGDVSLYQGGFPNGTQTLAVTVPLAQLGAVCGDQISVATFATIGSQDSSGHLSTIASTSFGGSFIIRCSATVEGSETGGCTMGTTDWRQLASSTLATEMPAAWWEMHELQMCGFSLEEMLYINPGSDVWLLLAQQYVTAKLNLANGAASTDEIDTAMTTTALFLTQCKIGLPIEADAIALAQTLKFYNLGETGPGACAG